MTFSGLSKGIQALCLPWLFHSRDLGLRGIKSHRCGCTDSECMRIGEVGADHPTVTQRSSSIQGHVRLCTL